MQYTGLKDKNGKEIYEGDILEYRVGSFVDTILVKWGKVEFSFLKKTKVSPTKVKWKRGTYQGLHKYGTVVGNIYENPELLEE